MQQAMVEIRNLTKRFGPLTAVDDVSFSVERGEVLGFLGPNGAGKSTTMKMITGFLTPDAGSIHVGGEDVSSHPIATKRRIGYLPEGAPLYSDMTPRAFLDFIADVRGLAGAEKRRRVDETVEQVSLQSALEKPIDTLSKGFKRRVGLAQAILHDPEVLILDEPTDGLDPNQKHEVRTLIEQMSENKVIILSTHILEEVDAVCSRATIISRGRVVSDGTPEALLARSRSHNSVRLTVRGAGDGIADAVSTLEGVGQVEVLHATEQRLALHVFPAGDDGIAIALGDEARARGWEVEELHVERGRLDEVFRDITTADEPA